MKRETRLPGGTRCAKSTDKRSMRRRAGRQIGGNNSRYGPWPDRDPPVYVGHDIGSGGPETCGYSIGGRMLSFEYVRPEGHERRLMR